MECVTWWTRFGCHFSCNSNMYFNKIWIMSLLPMDPTELSSYPGYNGSPIDFQWCSWKYPGQPWQVWSQGSKKSSNFPLPMIQIRAAWSLCNLPNTSMNQHALCTMASPHESRGTATQNRASQPGRHYWDYYPGALSLSQYIEIYERLPLKWIAETWQHERAQG